ncbi:DUF3558 family protein [Amycolatopsis taiwanensis]|uniref:DUF3558 domain-containing protein n=1 Tax=Amycolatopsis taiwanensis TaxID=342230 RepID=A0A9W6QXS1_9PSEU|nr:DUF3558 family protein [Amycolatopsis taiwanensis]GLY64007.1 hypothetical protein Atai01_06260 [Amycolatopsis taiwanensis]
MRTAALTTVIAAAALAAAACTSKQPGQPSPSSGQSAGSGASSSPSSGAANGLAGLNACSLLTDDEAKQVVPGVNPPIDQGELGGTGTNNCQWNKSVTNGAGGVAFSITVRPAQGLEDVNPNGGQTTKTTSNAGRQVVLLTNSGSGISCIAAVAVGSGRVDIEARTLRGATTEEMCTIVEKTDGFVEPKLPAS